ncbi:MAG: Ldh family oxidoreductase [Phycisphaeraceae bacterium]|nr:Ldh family oxidoreductase [Phycisphaeraceae bacterium]
MVHQPSATATRVPHERLQSFIYDAARQLDIPQAQAELLSQLLIANDLRGVLSHGSQQMLRYAREIRSGNLKPQSSVRCIRETPTSLMMDGDGGLGYFPAYEGTLRMIEKANQHGMAALVTRNHGHIGAAGIYTRLTLQHDMLAFATSGVQLKLKPGTSVYAAAGGSPMSFSAPAEQEPSLVVDVGVTHDLQGNAPHRDEIARIAPGLALRAIGYGTICQTWGGFLTGLPVDANRANRRYPAANQGAMLFAIKIALFADPDQFKREIDEYARQVRQLTPIEGTEGAFLPGSVEAHREAIYRESGIPLGSNHLSALQTLAEELGLAVPWL